MKVAKFVLLKIFRADFENSLDLVSESIRIQMRSLIVLFSCRRLQPIVVHLQKNKFVQTFTYIYTSVTSLQGAWTF